MRHRHLGPKVKYITRRNNIRYRQRPTHSQSLIRRNRQFRRPVRRMRQKLPDVQQTIRTAAGEGRYIGTEIEDEYGRWNDSSYETRDGYWVIHEGDQHHVYFVPESEY